MCGQPPSAVRRAQFDGFVSALDLPPFLPYVGRT